MSESLNKADSRLARLNNLVESVLAAGDLYRVETRIKGSSGQAVINVFIDGDAGVTIDQCAEVSRALHAAIELDGLFQRGFRLDVSSPGLDQPLRLPRQYVRHIGRELDVMVKTAGGDDAKRLSGRLVGAEESGITIASADERIDVRFDDIVRAVVTPSFKTGLVE